MVMRTFMVLFCWMTRENFECQIWISRTICCDCKNAGYGDGNGNNDHDGDENIYGVALPDDEGELGESDLDFEDDDEDF